MLCTAAISDVAVVIIVAAVFLLCFAVVMVVAVVNVDVGVVISCRHQLWQMVATGCTCTGSPTLALGQLIGDSNYQERIASEKHAATLPYYCGYPVDGFVVVVAVVAVAVVVMVAVVVVVALLMLSSLLLWCCGMW